MLGLGTSVTNIDSGQIYKELSELENYSELEIHFDFSTIAGAHGDAVAAATNLAGEFTFVDGTCDYNNDPTINHDADSGRIIAGMKVTGTGVPADSTVSSITSERVFELSASTIGGSVEDGDLTFQSVEDLYSITSNGGTPTLDTNTMGRHSVSFDGGNDALNMAASYVTTGKPMTLFIVAQGTDVSGGGNDYILANAGDDEDISHIRIKSGTGIQTLWDASEDAVSTSLNSTANSTTDYTIPDAKNFAMVFRRDSDGKLYIYADQDGFVGFKNNSANNDPTDFTLGAIGGTSEGTSDFHGYIGEVGLYNADISDDNILILLDELCTKWGITR